jgi:glycosyltransferase involved in cell wall biosynthesis
MAIQLPTVAVVTPVYNGAKFLREAMLSVQAQTYPNLVHFVLDNASTDATPDIIKEFDGGRVPVVTARNEALLPIAQNWNRCVELGSQGNDYFRVLCTDESLQPTCIEKMVALAETDPLLSVVGCNHSTTFGLEDLHWDRTRAIFSGSEAARSCLVGECGLATSHLLYRTSVLSLRRKFFEEDASFNFHFDTEAAFFGTPHRCFHRQSSPSTSFPTSATISAVCWPGSICAGTARRSIGISRHWHPSVRPPAYGHTRMPLQITV